MCLIPLNINLLVLVLDLRDIRGIYRLYMFNEMRSRILLKFKSRIYELISFTIVDKFIKSNLHFMTQSRKKMVAIIWGQSVADNKQQTFYV